ncbi:MAG: hypothetical protein K2Q23_03265 [Bryobacteraceae bacterium]|nr:hypothetical protein [Bryobacteraceae bacterium]
MIRTRFSLLIACSAMLAGQLFAAENFRLKGWMQGAPSKKASRGGANDYRLVRIPVPDGYFGGVAVDVNNRRTVAGVFLAINAPDATFTWNEGEQPVIIQNPNALITSVPSILDSGVLFGNWGSITEQTAGFHDPRAGRWTPLPPYPGKNLNIGYRANNAGRATGQACEGNWFQPSNCVWWFWNGRSYEPLQTPSGIFALVDGLNDIGTIVGRYLIAPPFDYRAFLIDRSTTTILLPDTKSAAYDVNNRNEVVINFESEPDTLFIPALYRNEVLTLLPLYPGAFGTTYIGINDRGDLSGLAYDLLGGMPGPPYPIVGWR